MHQILSQFLTPLEKIVPSDVCTSKPWSFPNVCKNLGAQQPLGAKICLPKSRFGWVWFRIEISIIRRPKVHRTFFPEHGKITYLQRTPKILYQNYKIEHTSNHDAKFPGNQPTKLRDLVAGKKEVNASKTEVRSENYHLRAN